MFNFKLPGKLTLNLKRKADHPDMKRKVIFQISIVGMKPLSLSGVYLKKWMIIFNLE